MHVIDDLEEIGLLRFKLVLEGIATGSDAIPEWVLQWTDSNETRPRLLRKNFLPATLVAPRDSIR